ncbi:hypothetical protein HOLleu_43590 [Holothuria leucospilota]|uniref:Uncharacterized protein n=1 Tax=Holothuria leucospilota TaxID=206669 RepID=A0A9Q0YBF6_HOLLE|nr:hypothetical protein HOLleu_43590 [Holothuria leucospilota]
MPAREGGIVGKDQICRVSEVYCGFGETGKICRDRLVIVAEANQWGKLGHRVTTK